MDNIYKEIIRKHEEAQTRLDTSLTGFLKNLTTIAIGFLGLLIGLKPTEINNNNAKIFFLITVASLGLGIIFSLITQFYPVYKNKWTVGAMRRMMVKSMNGDKFQFESMKTPWYFWLIEIMAYVSLGLSMISIIVYVFFLELNI